MYLGHFKKKFNKFISLFIEGGLVHFNTGNYEYLIYRRMGCNSGPTLSVGARDWRVVTLSTLLDGDHNHH